MIVFCYHRPLTNTDDVVVTVNPANQPPVVSAGSDQTITLPHTANLNGMASDDGLPTGSKLATSWTKVSGPGAVTFSNASATSPVATFSDPGVYLLRLTASDSEFTVTGDVRIKVIPANNAPIVNAGADQAITLPDAANLNGTATDDGLPTGSALAVAWSAISGPGAVAFRNPNQAATIASFSTAGTYVLRLSANDSELTSSKDITITVNPPVPVNQPPLVNAGADQTITLPNSANLIGTVSDDGLPTGGAITVTWSKASGPSTVAFSNPDRVTTTASFNAPGVYVLCLTASDSLLTSASDVTITVAASSSLCSDGDDFNDNTLDPAKWYVGASNGVTILEQSQHLEVTPPAAATGYNGYFGAVPCVDLTNAHAAVEVVQTTAPIYGIETYFTLIDANNNALIITEGGSNFLFAVVSNGVTVVRTYIPYDSVQQRFWRFRHDPAADTISWESSPDNLRWTTHRTVARLFPINGLYAQLYAGKYTASTPTSTAIFDNLKIEPNGANVPPAVSITSPANGASFNTPADVTISAAAQDGDGTISKVEFYADNALLSVATSAPYTANWSNVAAGNHSVKAVATDNAGAATASIPVNITVNNPAPTPTPTPAPVNRAPSISVVADQAVTLPNTASLSGTITDDGLPAGSTIQVVWNEVSGPSPVTFSSQRSPSTTATLGVAGTYVLRLTAGDSQLTSSSDVTIMVKATNRAPVVNVGANQTITLPDTAVLNGSVTDDGLPNGSTMTSSWSMVSGAGTVAFNNPNSPATTASFSAAGVYVLRLTASDSELTSSADVTVTVNPSTPPPTVGISSPAEGTEITSRTNFTGSVSNGTWKLEYSLNSSDGAANNQTWTTFASGSAPVTDGVLGTFDPTLLLNGIYTVRLVATDASGQISYTSTQAIVGGNQKIGNFTVSFDDLSVPVAGLPIQITRTYDSRDKRVGDFGVGWTMSIASVRLEKTAVIGQHWAETVSGGAFPTYCLQETKPHIITITFPGGRVYKFKATTTPQCQRFANISATTIGFTAMPGTHGTLVADGSIDALVAGNVPGPVDLLGYDNADYFNSTLFRLTTEDGTVYLVDQRGGVKSVTDTNGNSLTITRDGITHSSGTSVSFARDAQGRINAITDPAGNALTYAYDANGDLTSFHDRESSTTAYAYNNAHFLLSITDPRGLPPIRNEYDDTGRLLSHTDAFGKTINYDHDLVNRVETVTDRLGNNTQFAYDERGNVLKSVDALGNVKTFTYDGDDNVLSETNALGKTTTYAYDGQGRRTSVTDASGNKTTYTYNNVGQPLTIADALGHAIINTYDAGGSNLLTSKDELGNTTTFAYNVYTGQRTSMTDALGNKTTYEYNGNNVKGETDAAGNKTSYGYDLNGNRTIQSVTRTTAAGVVETLTSTTEYDKDGRPTKTVSPDGAATQTVYTSTGQPGATIDQAERRTAYVYDEMGRLTRTTYPDNTKEESVYDAEGHRTKSTDRAGRITLYSYDALGRLEKTPYADGTFTKTAYDAIGQVTAVTDARGNITKYDYDASGRRTKVTDAKGKATVFAYDTAGNQLSITDALNHAVKYEYDALNRRTKTIYADTSTETVVYDALGRVTSKTDQAGKTTQSAYDNLGRLIKVTDASGITHYGYDARGRLETKQTPQGTLSYTYDATGNLLSTSSSNTNGASINYAYDALNRLSTVTDNRLTSCNAPLKRNR